MVQDDTVTKKAKEKEGGAIINFIVMVSKIASMASHLVELISYETKLAHGSFFKAVILALMTGLLLTTTWVCLLGILVYYLVMMQVSLPLSLLIVIVINILLTIIVLLLFLRSKDELSFRESRKALRDITKFD